MKSKEITVLAVWEEFVLPKAGTTESGKWIHDGVFRGLPEQPETLRASLAATRLTVWLPSGKRVQCRRPRFNKQSRQFYYFWRDRFSDLHRIVFTIPPEVALQGEGA